MDGTNTQSPVGNVSLPGHSAPPVILKSPPPPAPAAATPKAEPTLDFTTPSEIVRVVAEGERLSFGHLFNPAFAAEISQIDPLPHQRIAVYDHMLRQPHLRFLLADDAGAGKTIMAGLYIREMLSRRLLRRVLIVPPAGLVGNWRRELLTLFNLPFRIISGADARDGNPFIGEDSDRIIAKLDTLAGDKMFSRLRDPNVTPYDLVIFDEAHKLAADRGNDMRVRKTDRYRLAEALAGAPGLDHRWRLPWHAQHLLLLTATPHMGRDYPYYALWRLLDPQVLSTPEAFNAYPAEHRRCHFIRRTKEEMVKLDGKPLYPTRISDTHGYDLSQGEVSEQRLYDDTTDYLRHVYNRAKLLNRSAARLAMSVFQRRLASSTFALFRSLERRMEKLQALIQEVQQGRLTMEQLTLLQRQIADQVQDVLDSKTADEENPKGPAEENETAEDRLMQGVVAASLVELYDELKEVAGLRNLAEKVYQAGTDSKYEKLRDLLTAPEYANEKFIVFTEHRDTLTFLVRSLEGMGYTGQVAQIHGGMDYPEREEQVENFRKPASDGGARFLIATDAAGEGINLQFCWIMINYDIPWNPARLEQRMGRIHRYLQKHDPVVILNLVAPKTREGKVLKTLLDKMEKIRKELHSDKVYDVIGRVFAGVSIRQYMEQAVTGGAEEVAQSLDGRLTKEQVAALAAREKSLYGSGGDVARELPRLRDALSHETYCRLLPGYVRQFIESSAPLLNLRVDGDLSAAFSFTPAKPGALDALLPALEQYPAPQCDHLMIERPTEHRQAVWLHPGEPVFEQYRRLLADRFGPAAHRGAIFVDPTAEKPYLFHLALTAVIRDADPAFPDLAQSATVECRLLGVKQAEGSDIALCPVEHLLLLKGGAGLPAAAQRIAAAAELHRKLALAFLNQEAQARATDRQTALQTALPEREQFLRRGFDYQEAELAATRATLTTKAHGGNKGAALELARVKDAQQQLAARRDQALATLRREPELIAPGPVQFIAHALVVPSADPADKERYDAQVELVAMTIARAHEEAEGARVKDVHTPELARAAGLPDNPGFDLLSLRKDGTERGIEVKGRADTGEVEVTANEWAKACNMRLGYWLYAVYDCATPTPRLARVQDPFTILLAKAKGSVLISPRDIFQASA